MQTQSHRVAEQDLDEDLRRARFEALRPVVATAAAAIEALDDRQCVDQRFLEHELIPSLGLNDEVLDEQPPELSRFFGRGLHLWQYPNQLAGYLVWLARNAASITSYMEIGCRWGGMLILTAEWLRRNGAELDMLVAVDPIAPTAFIDAYFGLVEADRAGGRRRTETIYLRELSTSAIVRDVVRVVRPAMVLIDGEHSFSGALADHMLVRDTARIVVHHDVSSDACPETTALWSMLKRRERDRFEAVEFVDQYDSVAGRFLGIGVLRRKP